MGATQFDSHQHTFFVTAIFWDGVSTSEKTFISFKLFKNMSLLQQFYCVCVCVSGFDIVLDPSLSLYYLQKCHCRTFCFLLQSLFFGNMFFLIIWYNVAILVRLVVEDFLFPFCGGHLSRVLFPPFRPPVLEPYLEQAAGLKTITFRQI